MICVCVCVCCRHFDKDRNGKLEHQEFKSCLRSLGYDIALMESGEADAEFEAVLDQVDPNRWAWQPRPMERGLVSFFQKAYS